jgi:aspartate/methionine/tyrosine aminotransferase
MSVELLSNRINALEESATLGMTKKARELAALGHKVISLSVGEPDFKTPKHICDAAKDAIDAGFHGYSPVAGILTFVKLSQISYYVIIKLTGNQKISLYQQVQNIH